VNLGTGRRVIDYKEGSLYTEGAIDKFSVFTVLPYRNISEGSVYRAGSGFGDMIVGTKTMFLDSELLLVSMQTSTFIPTGNTGRGAGTGHVSIEPALLTALNVCPGFFIQSELAYRFPIGGDPDFQGPMFHYHVALNKLLWECGKSFNIVGTLGFDGYNVTGGSFTTFTTNAAGQTIAVVSSAKDIGNMFYVSPGARINFCDKADFGIGTSFALTEDRFARQIVRIEARFRF
jgi:hypothetical protein